MNAETSTSEEGQERPEPSVPRRVGRLRLAALVLGFAAAVLHVLDRFAHVLPRTTEYVTLFLAGAALALWVESVSRKKR